MKTVRFLIEEGRLLIQGTPFTSGHLKVEEGVIYNPVTVLRQSKDAKFCIGAPCRPSIPPFTIEAHQTRTWNHS